MKSPRTEFDAVVVGSGPGGATVARELSLQGRKVLILEWGDNDPVKGTIAQTVPRAFVPGKGLLITPQMLAMIRAITTGGSSLIYCATAFEPPIEMLKSYGVDISTEVDEVKNEIPIAPLCDELMGEGPGLFLKSATELGYNAHKLNDGKETSDIINALHHAMAKRVAALAKSIEVEEDVVMTGGERGHAAHLGIE